MGRTSARRLGLLAAMAALALLPACSSRADRASRAAIAAEGYLQRGDIQAALRSAREATSERDDISDYWQLLARIALAANQPAVAYSAYQHAIELDPNNGEVLNALGRLGLSLGQARDVDGYADRILLADPGNRGGQVMKAAAALQRGDKAAAERYVTALLASNPQDPDGLMLRARLLANGKDMAGAARIIEDSLKTAPGDPLSRLGFLRTLYTQSNDRPNLRRTLQRMAATQDAPADARLAYAAMLYEEGQPGPAGEAIAALMARAPDNIDTATDILELWRDAGAGAPPVAALSAAASQPLSLEMKAVTAIRADDLGRPDIALAILGPDIATAATTTANADARAAYAGALALRGDSGQASAMLAEILGYDPGQPRALMARARLLSAQRRFPAAVADLRRVVTDDPQNATARLALADALRASGDADLALAQLREGARAVPDNVRLAGRLAETLIANGDKAGASDALADLTRAAPASTRAWRLQADLCAQIGDTRCAAAARAALQPEASKPAA